MNFDTMPSNFFAYANDAIAGTLIPCWLLVVATILLCLPLPGYTLKVNHR
jgi:hypothetical protein